MYLTSSLDEISLKEICCLSVLLFIEYISLHVLVSTVTITERAVVGIEVSAITSTSSPIVTAGTATGGLAINLNAREATLFGAAGLTGVVNTVTFTNTIRMPVENVPAPKFDFDGDGRLYKKRRRGESESDAFPAGKRWFNEHRDS